MKKKIMKRLHEILIEIVKADDADLDKIGAELVGIKGKTYMGSNKNKGYEYDADRLYSSQKDKEKQLKLEKESRYG